MITAICAANFLSYQMGIYRWAAILLGLCVAVAALRPIAVFAIDWMRIGGAADRRWRTR
jgi:hypothetical protein